MSEKDTGGPAYPTRDYWDDAERNKHEHGMTLRDWFAGQALAGVMASAEEHFTGDGKSEKAIADWHDRVETNWATFCYRMADAMIAERSK